MRMVQIKVVRAAGVARGLHTEFSRAVTAEKIAFDDAVADDETRLRGDAFGVEIGAAEGAGNVRLFAQAEEIGQDFSAYAVNQETALAVERAAAECADEVSDKAACDGGIEEDGIAARRDAAAVQTT